MTPVITTCFYCGKDTGVALVKAKAGKDPPHRGCLDCVPCTDCDEFMAKGILLLGCGSGGPSARTGKRWIVRDADIGKVFPDPAAVEEVLKYRCAFLTDEAAASLSEYLVPAEVKESLADLKVEVLPWPALPTPLGEVREWVPWKDKLLCRRQARTELGGNTVEVRYGWSIIGDQDPYLSITADQFDAWDKWISGGTQPELVAKVFPDLRRLQRWHLCSVSEPMHYVANALYWWQQFKNRSPWGKDYSRPLQAFASTIVFGAVENDASRILEVETDEEVTQWLVERKQELMAAMWADVEAYGLIKSKGENDDREVDG